MYRPNFYESTCLRCNEIVYQVDRVGPLKDFSFFHSGCFKCCHCGTKLTLKTYFNNQHKQEDKEVNNRKTKARCQAYLTHWSRLFIYYLLGRCTAAHTCQRAAQDTLIRPRWESGKHWTLPKRTNSSMNRFVDTEPMWMVSFNFNFQQFKLIVSSCVYLVNSADRHRTWINLWSVRWWLRYAGEEEKWRWIGKHRKKEKFLTQSQSETHRVLNRSGPN